jgi:hypothetical protein
MASHVNPTCAKCPKAYEQLNGRYCTVLKRIVEYDKQPLCKQDKK